MYVHTGDENISPKQLIYLTSTENKRKIAHASCELLPKRHRTKADVALNLFFSSYCFRIVVLLLLTFNMAQHKKVRVSDSLMASFLIRVLIELLEYRC